MGEPAAPIFPVGVDEPARLAALRRYAILDTLPEQPFDDLTLIAATICDAPIALVNLLDEDRGWFKARVGLEALEVPRGTAMCAWAIAEPDKPFVIEDLTRDARFASNPLVTGDPDLRFYAGAPLVTPDGHALGTLCVLDRTPRRLAEHEIRALEALARQVVRLIEERRRVVALEEAVARRRAAEEAARSAGEQAETASRAKTELLSRVSHELRTPLNAILGFGELVRSDERLDPALTEDVDAVLDAGRRLLAMVDGVLDVGRVEGGAASLDREPVALAEAAAEVVAEARPLADRAGVRLEAGAGAETVLADREALKQVLFALVSNGIAFNRRGGRVEIGAHTTGGEVRIAVRDDGPGIDAADLPRLFTAFDRLGAEGSGAAGAGLGLPLARHLLGLMGGRIEIESRPGEGSTFTVALPRADEAGGA